MAPSAQAEEPCNIGRARRWRQFRELRAVVAQSEPAQTVALVRRALVELGCATVR